MSISTMPAQKPRRSKQDYATPDDFMLAVEARFGPIAIDLAANASNAKSSLFLSPNEDSLTCEWPMLDGGIAWLNPEFANIDPWAAKCARYATQLRAGGRILLLTPASVGANWFADHVHHKAFVYGLSPRLKFIGAKDAYPKDCILSVFGAGSGFDVWRWK